jgi:6-phosphogluconolactonase (cycloisomerase 2 family)
MRTLSSTKIVALLLFVGACSGGGGATNPGSGSIDPPTNLSYPDAGSLYFLGAADLALTPTITGQVDLWRVAPALPPGVEIDAVTGVIQGPATATSPTTTYNVTAGNDGGAITVQVSFRTVRAANWAYTANVIDSTISAFAVEAATGLLHYAGNYRDAAARPGPQAVIPHPTLPVIYVPNLWNASKPSDLSTFAVNQATGALYQQAPVSLGTSPHFMSIHPNGLTAYVANHGSDSVRVFRIDDSTGLLTFLDNVPTGDGPNDLTLDPEGRFAFLPNNRDETVSVFAIEASSGILQEPGITVPMPGKPSKLRVDPQGKFLFVLLADTQQVTAWNINPATGALTFADTEMSCASPASIDIHPTQPLLYVPSLTSDSVFVYAYDPTTGDVIPSQYQLQVSSQPNAFTLDESHQNAYVTCSGSKDVLILDMSVPGQPTVRDWKRGRRSPRVLGLIHGKAPLAPRADGLYVLNQGDDSIAAFDVDPVDGSLVSIGTEWMSELGASCMAIDPRGRHLCVCYAISNTLQIYSINHTDRTLSPVGPPHPLPDTPAKIALDPLGKHVFISYPMANMLESYTVNSNTGELRFTATIGTLAQPEAIAIDPTGQFLYLSAEGASRLLGFRLNNGQFTAPLGNLTTPEGTTGALLSFSRHADTLYAVLNGSGLVLTCTIDATSGLLTPVGQPASTGGPSLEFICHPSKDLAYAPLVDNTSNGEVGHYGLDPFSGFPSHQGSSSIGLAPVDLGFDPLGRFLYLADSDSGQVTVLTVGPGGQLTETSYSIAGSDPLQLLLRRAF